MRSTLLIVLFFIIITPLFSQDEKLSVDLNHPITIDNNFVGSNLNGVIGIGANYYFLDLAPIHIGGALDGGFLIDNNEFGPGNSKLITFQPKVVAEMRLGADEKIRPYVGLGYSFLFFTGTGYDIFNGVSSTVKETLNGLNINAGITFNFTTKLFAKAQYDYMAVPSGVSSDVKFNKRVNIIKVGVGYRF